MYMIIGPGGVFTKTNRFLAKQTVQLMGTETADLQDDPNILGMQQLHTVCVADGKCHWARIFWVLTSHWMITIYESIAWDMIWNQDVSSVFSFDFFFRCLKGKCLHRSGRSGSLGQLCGTNGRTVTQTGKDFGRGEGSTSYWLQNGIKWHQVVVIFSVIWAMEKPLVV